MPYRLRAAFFPARLGGYLKGADLANGLSQLIFMTAVCFLSDTSFTTHFFGFYSLEVCRAAGQITTQVRLPGKTPGGDRVCLDFLFLFHQGKRNRRGNAVPDQKIYAKRSMVDKSKPAVAGCFVLLS